MIIFIAKIHDSMTCDTITSSQAGLPTTGALHPQRVQRLSQMVAMI